MKSSEMGVRDVEASVKRGSDSPPLSTSPRRPRGSMIGLINFRNLLRILHITQYCDYDLGQICSKSTLLFVLM